MFNVIAANEELIDSVSAKATDANREIVNRNRTAVRLCLAHELGHGLDYACGSNTVQKSFYSKITLFDITEDGFGSIIGELYGAFMDNKGGLWNFLGYPFNRLVVAGP